MSIEEIAANSEAIVEGRVISRSVERDPASGVIYTEVVLEVLETVRGRDPGDRLTLRFLGGQLGNQRVEVTHLAVPQVGERGIYFVESLGERLVNPLVGWDQGRFPLRADARTGTLEVWTAGGAPVYGLAPSPSEDVPLTFKPGDEGPRGLRRAPEDAADRPMTPDAFKAAVRSLSNRAQP